MYAKSLRWRGASVALLGAGAVLLASVVWPVAPEQRSPHSGVSLRVTDRTGQLLREVRPEGSGQPIALQALPPFVAHALVAVEDRRFYRHPGLDLRALARATWTNLKAGGVVSGGSTLTMQVARMLRGGQPRTLYQKLAEMHLALRLEAHLSKDEILALWLNRAPFGHGAYGIEAAARQYFGKSARDLALPEAALLVGLPQSPSWYDPFRYPDRAQTRQRRVLAALVRTGAITSSEAENYASFPLAFVPPERTFQAPHFVEHLLAQARPEGGAVEWRTTLDLGLQETVARLVRAHLRLLKGQQVTQAAAIVVDNATGEVLAYVGSGDFWAAEAGGQNDGVQMLRQPGSALKPFTYGHALATRRYTAASILPDLPLQVPEAGGAFSPENYDGQYHGPVPLRQALACSYNVPAVGLAREIGPAALLQTLHEAGFASLTRPADVYGVGLTLGSGEVRLMELAYAYAGLARGGVRPPVRTVQWYRTATGDTIRAASSAPQANGLSPEVAYLLTDILQDPEARAPAFGRGGPLELPFPCAVKTGTSKDYRDNWTVGYTPRHTVAVWVGNFDGRPMQWVSGVTGAGPLFKAIMLALGEGGPFARPPGLAEATVCPSSGAVPGAACPVRQRSLFLPGAVPADTCRVHQRLRIDRRTGLLAEADAPEEAVVEQLFTVHPPVYHGWMQAQGLPLPPRVSASEVLHRDEADGARYADGLQIAYPASGTVFQLDPVLRAAYQRLHLRGVVAGAWFDAGWWINGERLAGDYRTATWPLRPGRHRIELRARDAEGRTWHSRPVEITVLG